MALKISRVHIEEIPSYARTGDDPTHKANVHFTDSASYKPDVSIALPAELIDHIMRAVGALVADEFVAAANAFREEAMLTLSPHIEHEQLEDNTPDII